MNERTEEVKRECIASIAEENREMLRKVYGDLRSIKRFLSGIPETEEDFLNANISCYLEDMLNQRTIINEIVKEVDIIRRELGL